MIDNLLKMNTKACQRKAGYYQYYRLGVVTPAITGHQLLFLTFIAAISKT